MTQSHIEYPSYSEYSLPAPEVTPVEEPSVRHLNLVSGIVEIQEVPQDDYKYMPVKTVIPATILRQRQTYQALQAAAYEAGIGSRQTDDHNPMARLHDEMNNGFYRHQPDTSSFDQGIAHL